MENSSASPETGDVENDAPLDSGEQPIARKPGSKGQGRKRTKTGCLTCRKRRIKCGEERPTCHNCTKSKRQCEGYNQRVVFKTPINNFGPPASFSSASSVPGHSSQSKNRRGSQVQSATNRSTTTPKSSSTSPALVNTPVSWVSSTPSDSGLYSFQTSVTQENFPKTQQHAQSFDPKTDTVDYSHVPEPAQIQFQEYHVSYPSPDETDTSVKQENREERQPYLTESSHHAEINSKEGSHRRPVFAAQEQSPGGKASALAAFQPYHAMTDRVPPAQVSFPSDQELQRSRIEHQPLQVNDDSWDVDPSRQQEGHLNADVKGSGPSKIQSGTNLVAKPSFDYSVQDDDDPFDVSDDDFIMEDHNVAWQDNLPDQHRKSNDLGIQVVVAMKNGQPFHETQLRSVSSFINCPNMLATYVPSPQASPLNDPMTARIFCHFINVTGPCISMFERHPANPALIFQGQPVPVSEQHMWTYTFPALALRNPALLHSMLAIASLHIAQVQNGPVTASLKHYAISLRRVGKLISSPKQSEPATLAAALLLAFYECWCADHQKWSNHVMGARQLIRFIDFAGMTKHIKRTKIRQRQNERIRYYQTHPHETGNNAFEERMRYQAYMEDIDENLVGILLGKNVRYDQHGQILDDIPHDASEKPYSEKDIEAYESQRDLYWWYCKADVYQSILGGGRLFMDYELWAGCPPRAPIGRLNEAYGTYDHVILLMGRLADFAAKDVKRKRLAMKANGGYRPPYPFNQQHNGGEFQGHAAPNQPPPQQASPQMPGFDGLLPVIKPQLPMGFPGYVSDDGSTQSHRGGEPDLAAQLAEAEEEWQAIRNGFSILEDHFGEDLQALGPEFSTPIQSPFGTALQYRTYGIAGIWMSFHMGVIVCHRTHPSMPPAAMMAQGIAARQTAYHANEIGRIMSGIAPDCDIALEVNPRVAGALMESTFGIFIAAVQYQDTHQRRATINHLRHVARLTGWQTAIATANGLETTWTKAAEMGRGAPYTACENLINVARKHTRGDSSAELLNIGRRIDRAFEGRTGEEKRAILSSGSRAHYALGVLGLESDLEGLGLYDEDEKEKVRDEGG
ncbi:hypothetical protein HYFRA_00002542 [Hymenoscyphus fraxineus]|uniref:Zn(2)-C6 fungal-type domain-containing protein n=1 Tax=Hymenoscyphus fraxineus TaxID=746836 RepID=A0A9N9LCL0_9HELO|nr:hypothetical protein HYFRA_00002542 [Hymenoscyphus fraxineus]